MTAKQKAARAKFKAIVKEAGLLRKKNPKLTQAQAVKQAWAISYNKKRSGNKVGATKIKAKKSKKTSEMHTDTKSHNVRISVMSGNPEGNIYKVRDQLEKDIVFFQNQISNWKKENINNNSFVSKIAKSKILQFKKVIFGLKKQLKEQNKLINSLLK
jgi:hypothetical protein